MANISRYQSGGTKTLKSQHANTTGKYDNKTRCKTDIINRQQKPTAKNRRQKPAAKTDSEHAKKHDDKPRDKSTEKQTAKPDGKNDGKKNAQNPTQNPTEKNGGNKISQKPNLSVVLGELHGVGDLFQVSYRRLTGMVKTLPNANGVNPSVQQLLRL